MEEPAEAVDKTERMRGVVRAAMQRNKASQAVVAREIGISSSALSQWLSGVYAGNSDTVTEKVAAWDASRQAGAAICGAADAAWVETSAASEVEIALTYAQHYASIAVIYGGAGLGKTTGVKRYAARNPNVWRVTARPATASLMAMLELVANALELRDIQNRPSAYTTEIARRMTGTRGLLVVDEAQHVSTQALEELRSIHDDAEVGLAMVGNEAVYSRLTGGSRKATFAQLFSRVGIKQRVRLPTRADTDAILAAWGVEGAKEREWSHQVATLPGGLRGLAQTLRQARLLSSQEDGAVDLRALQTAWRNLGGES
jgi:hypothetical protein